MRRINLIESYAPIICRMVIAIALTGSLSAAFTQQPRRAQATESVADLLKRGLQEFEKGDYKAAAKLFTKVIALKPDEASAYFHRGLVADETSDFIGSGESQKDSFGDYTKAIQLNPKYAEAYYQRALGRSELKEKIEDFDLSIKANPRYAKAYYQRARTRMDEPHSSLERVRDSVLGVVGGIGDTDKDYLEALQVHTAAIRQAIEDFTRAIEIDPGFTDAYFERGRAYAELRDYQSAVDDFSVVVRLAPANVAAHEKLGLGHFDLGEYGKAVEDWTHALALKPGESRYYNKRGLARFKLGDQEGALDDYLESLRHDPVKLSKNYLQRLQTNPKSADAQYRVIEEFLPEILSGVHASNKLVAVDFARGMVSRYHWPIWHDDEFETVAQYFTDAIRHQVDYADAYYQRGLVRLEQKQEESAAKDFTEAIRLNPKNGAAHYSRGLAYYRLKDFAAAIEDFTTALLLNPEITNAFYQRGLSYYEAGNDHKAIEDFQRSLKDQPDWPDIFYRLGLAYERSGAHEEATRSFLQVVKLISPMEADQNLTRSLGDIKLARIYWRGLARFHLSLKMGEGNPSRLVGLDQELTKKNFLEQSENDFSAVIQDRPRVAELYYQRGRARLTVRLAKFSTGSSQRGNDSAGALTDFQQAVRLKPDFAKVYLRRGQFYADSLKPGQAILDFQRAHRSDLRNAEGHYELGDIYLENYQNRPADPKAALAEFTRALRIDPSYIKAYFRRAYIKSDQHNLRGAIDDYSEIIRRDPENAVAHRARGGIYLKLKDFSRALDDYNRAIELEPSEPGSNDHLVAFAYVDRAITRYNLGDGRGAKEDYRQALLIRPCLTCASGSSSISYANNGDGFLQRGLSLLRRGDKSGCKENLERAAKLFYAQGNMAQYQKATYELGKL